jgi:hypothetical protein
MRRIPQFGHPLWWSARGPQGEETTSAFVNVTEGMGEVKFRQLWVNCAIAPTAHGRNSLKADSRACASYATGPAQAQQFDGHDTRNPTIPPFSCSSYCAGCHWPCYVCASRANIRCRCHYWSVLMPAFPVLVYPSCPQVGCVRPAEISEAV